MMMYRPTTNMTASRVITAWTIQCACSNSRGMSSFAASVDDTDVGENPGIMSGSAIARATQAGQMWHSVTVAKPLRAVVFALCLAVHGCADVRGGAVELNWKLRASTGSD